MTPRLFTALVERYNRRREQEDYRAGEMISAIYNVNRASAETEAMGYRDVFPEWQKPEAEQTEDEMLNAMLMWSRRTEGQVS